MQETEARKRQITPRGVRWETTYPGHGGVQLPRGLDKRGRGRSIDRVIAVWWVGATLREVVDAVKGRRVRREVALRAWMLRPCTRASSFRVRPSQTEAAS